MHNRLVAIGFLALVACGKKDETPDPNVPQGVQPGQPGYVAPQPGQPGYVAPQPGYVAPQPGQPGYVAPQPGQAGYIAPQPAQPEGLVVPGPQALACQSDSQCMTHRCNLQYGKCAFPCATDVDCNKGSYCFRGPVPACLPKAPGQP